MHPRVPSKYNGQGAGKPWVDEYQPLSRVKLILFGVFEDLTGRLRGNTLNELKITFDGQ